MTDYDDFTGYTTGDIDGQGGWTKVNGLWSVITGGDYAWTKTTNDYYKEITEYGAISKIRFIMNIKFQINYWYYSPQFSMGVTEVACGAGCGLGFKPSGTNLDIWSGIMPGVTATGEYLGRFPFYSQLNTYIEWVHNCNTGRFEYIGMTNPNVFFEDTQGYAFVNNPKYWSLDDLQRHSYQETQIYDISTDYVATAKKYNMMPKWRKTQYGMRTIY